MTIICINITTSSKNSSDNDESVDEEFKKEKLSYRSDQCYSAEDTDRLDITRTK